LQLFVGDNLFEKHIRSVCETLTPSDDLDVKTISNKLDTPNDRIPIFELLRKYNINITRDLLPFHKSQLALYKAVVSCSYIFYRNHPLSIRLK
jgi:hypothetical protein